MENQESNSRHLNGVMQKRHSKSPFKEQYASDTRQPVMNNFRLPQSNNNNHGRMHSPPIDTGAYHSNGALSSRPFLGGGVKTTQSQAAYSFLTRHHAQQRQLPGSA